MEVSGLKFFCKLYNQMKVRGGFDAVRTLVIWGIRDWADCAFKVSLDKGTYFGYIVSLHKIYISGVIHVLEM